MTLQDIEHCGIIGAGGAGFPTHIKLASQPDTVIMNAAECEPLLHKDMQILLHHARTVINGFRIVLSITGAKRGIIGIKAKHTEEIALLRSMLPGDMTIALIDDVYPAGDEVTLIYMTTGRIVQPGALPISVGCLVQNVETLFNIGACSPVVDKFVSVAGAVTAPATVRVPIGTSYADVLSHFTIVPERYAVRSGGLMMGMLERDLSMTVSKRTGALIVLPADHHCITMYERYAAPHDTIRMAKAACDQCSFCTELCPRYLLGQPVRPETAMRNRMFTREEMPMLFPGNFSCCECNLCTMYACPEGLDPRGATVIEKRIAREQKIIWEGTQQPVHPMYEYRKVPTDKLMQRLDVVRYEAEGALTDLAIMPAEVRVRLDQHTGAPALSVVEAGTAVRRYDVIAKPGGAVSTYIHAPIDGIVRSTDAKEIIIQRT
ncbi:MAG TPA: 4Fe-4S dicluster domain-containing protein [Bacteroidota bacterium]|nr:4Fe-4S dicluster domain-containing protein [Bacteroidota bacterium]